MNDSRLDYEYSGAWFRVKGLVNACLFFKNKRLKKNLPVRGQKGECLAGTGYTIDNTDLH
jgi:hypothetical protein